MQAASQSEEDFKKAHPDYKAPEPVATDEQEEDGLHIRYQPLHASYGYDHLRPHEYAVEHHTPTHHGFADTHDADFYDTH